MDPLHESIERFQEYGSIYKNIKSDTIKEELIQSAPIEVINAFTVVIKNILIENIKVTPEEFEFLSNYKEIMKELGFKKKSIKRQRKLLAEGQLFLFLSGVMSKLSTPRSAYKMRSEAGIN